MSQGWIGVDFDGTLVTYNGWVSGKTVGEPIWPMIERVKRWLAEGKEVRIFTARIYYGAADDSTRYAECLDAHAMIQQWCATYLGRVLPITCVKDYNMIELWDDRAVQVERNTGRVYNSIMEVVSLLPFVSMTNSLPPKCAVHGIPLVLNFYDRPGSPPGNAWVCTECLKVPGQSQIVNIDNEGVVCTRCKPAPKSNS
jgi:hypothetical protein